MNINSQTSEYLAKLGVVISFNTLDNIYNFEKIDDPEEYAQAMGYSFIPPKLESDAHALDCIRYIDMITLYDEQLTQDDREIIVEDCYKVTRLMC